MSSEIMRMQATGAHCRAAEGEVQSIFDEIEEVVASRVADTGEQRQAQLTTLRRRLRTLEKGCKR